MKVIHLISGGDSGGAKTHVLSLLQNLNKTITAQLVCFRDGPFAEEARSMGIPTMICGGNNIPHLRRELTAHLRTGRTSRKPAGTIERRGKLRGMIRCGLRVPKGQKLGDVDPRGNVENCYTVSDKATAVGGGVLEAILHLSGALLED